MGRRRGSRAPVVPISDSYQAQRTRSTRARQQFRGRTQYGKKKDDRNGGEREGSRSSCPLGPIKEARAHSFVPGSCRQGENLYLGGGGRRGERGNI